MDQDRQIRLLIPPFFFYISLFLGIVLQNHPFWQWLKDGFAGGHGEHLIALGGAVMGSLLPVGFLISAITFLFLRLIFLPTHRHFEIFLSSDALKVVWPHLRTSLKCDRRYAFEAGITLDHELFSPGIHSWIMRRWNVFLISTQACVALGLAHCVAYFLGMQQPRQWLETSFLIGLVLAVNAVVAWIGTMKMFEFQAFRSR